MFPFGRLLELDGEWNDFAGHKRGGQKGPCSLKFFGSQLQFVLKEADVVAMTVAPQGRFREVNDVT